MCLWDLPDGVERCARGEASWSSASACARDRSIPTCFRIRSTSSARCAILRPRFASGRWSTCWTRSRLQGAGLARHLAVDGRWIELSGHAEHAQAHWLAGGGVARRRMTTWRPNQRLLVEYKPFEPAFYHTDIADWGMSSHFARAGGTAGARAGGHGPSLQRAEHRADCGVAAAHRHAGRVPLQRPALCRRRSDAGLDRSLPDLPHLPRDPCGHGRWAGASTSPT